MSEAISLQCSFFLISVLWGAILLVIYDILRILRRIKKHKWFTIAAEDLLFWLLSAFLVFRLMYDQNDGVIRAFSVLGMGLGMVIYNRSISNYFVEGVSRFVLFIGRQIHRLVVFVSKPFLRVGKGIKRGIVALGKCMGKIGKSIAKLLKKAKKHDTLEEQTRN